jgi:hypothetical protein
MGSSFFLIVFVLFIRIHYNIGYFYLIVVLVCIILE